jgi:copper resistance protein B
MANRARVIACLGLAWSAAAGAQHAEHAQHSAPAAAPTPMTSTTHSHGMIADPLNKLVLVDRLEVRDEPGDRSMRWDIDTWIGRELDKLWLRTSGERAGGETEHAELEALWGHGFARWWEVLAGARHDFAPGDDRTLAALGVRGLLPYRFELEATAYLGDGGRTAMRIETRYEVLVTNRLILTPLLEVEWQGQTDAARGRGAGLGKAELGLFLRYELRREIAPYIGVVRERHHGRTAEQLRALGDATEDTRWVAGVRLMF